MALFIPITLPSVPYPIFQGFFHALTPIIKSCQYASDLGLIDPKVNMRIKNIRIVIKPRLDDEDDDNEEQFLTREQIEQIVDYYN